jgi:arsenical pump membrane protein
VSEFVAANTWSIILVIGNPTNIYLAESFKIGFFDYFSKMWLGAIMAGLVGLAAMYAMFRKMLKVPFAESGTKPVLKDPFLAYLSLAFLGVTIIFMAFSDFIDIPMWVVSMAGALLLIIATVLYGIKKRSGFSALGRSFARLPYSVIPFILSMFVMVLSLKDQGVIGALADALARANPYVGAGVSSYFAANFLNNIPMTVFFTEIFRTMSAPPYTMIYLAIISSNIGAFLTPVGALAGVMWTRLLKDHGIKFSFADYIRYLSPVSLLSLVAAFAGFWLLAL